MTRFTIRHETLYEYERPVGFGPQRLLLRPHDSHAIRLLNASLTLSPPGESHWIFDAMGNSVCWFTPERAADRLSIVSELLIERFPAPITLYPVRDPKTASPVDYDLRDRPLLAPFMEPAAQDSEGLMEWLRAQIGASGEPAIDFLLRLTWVIHQDFNYLQRDAEGVQSPAQTLRLRSGSCRDFAWLMIEAVRRLGYAARFVTGYLYVPTDGQARGAGATHAWCQVFLPDLGWMEFDPTNGIAESHDLIPVAVARTPEEAAPVSGAIIGDPGRSTLTVSVRVDLAGPAAAAA